MRVNLPRVPTGLDSDMTRDIQIEQAVNHSGSGKLTFDMSTRPLSRRQVVDIDRIAAQTQVSWGTVLVFDP